MVLLLIKRVFYIVVTSVILAGCSGGSEESADKAIGGSDNNSTENSNEEKDVAFTEGEKTDRDTSNQPTNRMVIYNADLSLEVKDFQSSMEHIEEKASSYGGYVVESNTYHDGDETFSGTIAVRIPQESFQAFLNDAEGIAVKVYNRTVNGEDVTEEYVDLESRLRSKSVVEERLLDFMKKAEKTEDLLQISNDLGKVQEEIEQILGRIKYLENQSSFATVTISISEDKVVVPNIDNQDLNTWERTKKQFASSLNYLLAIGSGLIVLVVGNIPVVVFLLLILIPVFLIVRRNFGKRNRQE